VARARRRRSGLSPSKNQMPLLRIAIDLRMSATELLLPWPKVTQEVTLRIAVETGNDASELYKKPYSHNV
jgi:hypothetical protein